MYLAAGSIYAFWRYFFPTRAQFDFQSFDIWMILTASVSSQDTPYWKVHWAQIRRGRRSQFLRPKPCHILFTIFSNKIGFMRCGSTLLKSFSIFLKCCIDQGNQFLLQYIKINLLVNFYTLINEEKGCFLSSWSHPTPNHHKGWFLPLRHQFLFSGMSFFIHSFFIRTFGRVEPVVSFKRFKTL